MQKQIKIFKIGNTPEETENEINSWLAGKKGLNIINSFSSEIRLDEQISMPVLVFLYDDLHTEEMEVKRRHERVDLLEIIDYSVEDHHYRDFIDDISESGVFIRTSRMLPVGKEIVMTFMSPENSRPMKITGEIVRSLPEGVGVRFKLQSQVQSDIIRAIIEKLGGGRKK